jgi:hypothetical protein
MVAPEDLEKELTLRQAVARYDDLRMQESIGAEPLAAAPALELIALGELIVRKAGYGRQLSVRAARASGASWSQIGTALGMSKQAAWEAHARWIDEQERQHSADPGTGLDVAQVAELRERLS